ncbi:MAG: peptidylprolyl isomerase [Polyangiaceae bacterium]|nr:peptidylprolyl isomerase [Polyangiaceae bacterium]
MTHTQVGPGTMVELAYRLLDEDGDLVEESTLDDPFSYVHGYGQLFPAVEAALEGKVAGQRCTVKVPVAEAYGDRDPDAVFTLDRDEVGDPDSLKVEDVLEVEGDDGHVGALRVVEIVEGGFVVDGNHPLAGQDLTFDVEVADVRPATDEELETAERALEEADSCCDGEHDHDHPHPAPGLVQLRRRD